MADSSQPFDALLVLSFGGPEGNDEVLPFLENVTRGRNIPRERLKAVGKHYYHFDGVSPLNALNREIISHLEDEIDNRGWKLPVYFGNRNWKPFAEDTLAQMSRDGVRRAVVFATSAWAGYSGTGQYNDDIKRAQRHLAEQGLEPVELVKIRQFFSHPVFVRLMAESLKEAIAKVPAGTKGRTAVVFSAHSVPLTADEEAGAPFESNLYSRQVAEASRLVARAAGVWDYDVVYQSRSGNPKTPWLEPDVVDHLEELSDKEDIGAVVCCPIGFISDHMEVIWDLDTELKEAAEERGIAYVRARTAGPERDFAAMLLDLAEEAAGRREPEFLGEVTVAGGSVDGIASPAVFRGRAK